MRSVFDSDMCNDLSYYGNSELLGLIARELSCNPASCFAVNTVSWYNSLYSELSEFSDCRYQIEINEDLCPTQEPENEEELFDLLFNLTRFNPQGVILNYVVAKAIELGAKEGKNQINNIRKELTRKFNNAQNE